MKSNTLDIFTNLESNSSRLAKEAILKAELVDLESGFWIAVKLALDPFVNFYIKKIPPHTKQTGQASLTLTQGLEQLRKLSNREVTGNEGIEHLKSILENVSASDSLVIERVIAKDLKCGVSEATVNKIRPEYIPTYPVMLASGYDQKLVDRVSWPALCQLKLDGMRFNAIVRKGKVEFRSRNGREIQFPEGSASALLCDAFIGLAQSYDADYVFDGELLVVDAAGKPLDRKTGNGILNKAVKGTISEAETAQVRATLWDAIQLSHFLRGKYTVPYKTRLGQLDSIVVSASGAIRHLISVCPGVIVNNAYEAQRYFEKEFNQGQEGSILKTLDGIWEDKRSKGQIKYKGELEAELVIVDLERGTGKNAGRLGALVCESSDGVIRVNVGSGYTDGQRSALWAQGHDLVGQIVTVKYNARIKDKNSKQESLFLPIFVELRLDKSVANSSKEIK